MFAKLAWQAIQIFGDLFGEIPSKFDGRTPWTWPSHVDLTFSIAHDFVPATAKKANILEAAHGEVRVNSSTLLTFQHRYEGHRVARAGQHASQSIQVSKDSIAVRHIVTIGEGYQVIGADSNALSSDFSRCARARPLLIAFSIGRSPFASFLSRSGI